MPKPPEQFIIMTNEQLEALSEKLLNKHIQSLKKNAHEFDDDCLLTIAETCKFMDTTRATLNVWDKKGILPAVRKGGRVFYKKSDIMAKAKI